MMLRTLTRIVGILSMVVLALLGLGVTLYCLDGFISLGSARPDRLLDLPSVRRYVGHFLDQITGQGPTAALALLCGLAAMLLGLLLLTGTLRSSKQRLAVLEQDPENGVLAARPRTLSEIARAVAEQAPGATRVKRPKVALSRHGPGGKLKVDAFRTRTSDGGEVERAVTQQLEPITTPFSLRPRVRVRSAERGERVQ